MDNLMENKQQISLDNSSNKIRGMNASTIYLDDFAEGYKECYKI